MLIIKSESIRTKFYNVQFEQMVIVCCFAIRSLLVTSLFRFAGIKSYKQLVGDRRLTKNVQ